jgi:rhodanese-related sulfurtransferase
VDPWIVAIAAAAALVAVRLVLGGRRAPPEQVRERLAAGATVIDVRSPREFEGGAYPGARNIPLTSLADRLREIPRDRPVVLYCASGLRSASAARLLARSGFADVLNAGGLRHMPQR